MSASTVLMEEMPKLSISSLLNVCRERGSGVSRGLLSMGARCRKRQKESQRVAG